MECARKVIGRKTSLSITRSYAIRSRNVNLDLNMKLSILIPTFNRSHFLLKNLRLLCSYLGTLRKNDEIEIVVSDNCSTDDTHEKVKKFVKEHPQFRINYYHHAYNLGLEKNALHVLKEAKGQYVMFLGDDDFISLGYLEGVLTSLGEDSEISCIIPSFIVVDIDGKRVKKGRDTDLPNRSYKKGFKTCYINSWRGHQLSGLVLKREGLLSAYQINNVSNIYPFIFFVGYATLRGSTYHLTQYPVSVTDPGQGKKDWNYTEDGLLLDVFDNYIKLPLNPLQITKLQLKFIGVSSWRLWGSKKTGGTLLKNSVRLMKSDKTNWTFKVLFPLFVLYQFAHRRLRS